MSSLLSSHIRYSSQRLARVGGEFGKAADIVLGLSAVFNVLEYGILVLELCVCDRKIRRRKRNCRHVREGVTHEGLLESLRSASKQQSRQHKF